MLIMSKNSKSIKKTQYDCWCWCNTTSVLCYFYKDVFVGLGACARAHRRARPVPRCVGARVPMHVRKWLYSQCAPHLRATCFDQRMTFQMLYVTNFLRVSVIIRMMYTTYMYLARVIYSSKFFVAKTIYYKY